MRGNILKEKRKAPKSRLNWRLKLFEAFYKKLDGL
jgi:hypothetical protein